MQALQQKSAVSSTPYFRRKKSVFCCISLLKRTEASLCCGDPLVDPPLFFCISQHDFSKFADISSEVFSNLHFLIFENLSFGLKLSNDKFKYPTNDKNSDPGLI